MRSTFALVLVILPVSLVSAKDDDAEKLYRSMEQKVRAAKTLQIRYEMNVTDAAGKTGGVQGTLTLGEGDRLRADAEGKLFDQPVKCTAISDGANLKFHDAPTAAKERDEKAALPAKGLGLYSRLALPREGIFLCTLNMDRRGDLPTGATLPADFKFVGKENIGTRQAQVIQYTLRRKDAKDALTVKLWLDAETNLPLQRSITGGTSDWSSFTEKYREFSVDPKTDAMLFELPK